MRLPFTAVDEVGWYLDRAGEPNNVHLELALPGRLDPHRLRDAVAAALDAHPFARVRRVRPGPLDRRLVWEVAPGPDLDPVSHVSWAHRRELDDARTAFLAAAPALDTSPPLRVLLASGPDHDVVLLNVHHAALDGISCLRLARSVARRYTGDPDPVPPVDPLSVRVPPLAANGHAPRPARPRMPRRPVRIEAREADGRPGYGYRLLRLSRDRTAALCRPREGGETVNDVLLAALCLAVDRWNGHAEAPAGRIQVTMPLNARPAELRGEILGNLSRLVTITADPDDRPGRGGQPARLLASISEQTRRARVPARRPAIAPGLGLATGLLPVAVKAPLLASARRLARGLIDTSLLSNLGRVDEPLRFGDAGAADGLWFSTPAPMPRGLSVGAVTTGGRLHLCFRYRHALLGPAAAEAFARDYEHALEAVAAVF